MAALIEMCWRLIGPSNTPIVCRIYEGAAGRVEVRAFYNDTPDHLIRSEVALDIDIARDMAYEWKPATSTSPRARRGCAKQCGAATNLAQTSHATS
jgi:hypothetical protein